MEITEPQPPVSVGLFRAEWYKDWAFLLGSISVFIGAMSVGRNYANIDPTQDTDQLMGLVIDAGIASSINLAIFGFIPASIRRTFWKKKTPTFMQVGGRGPANLKEIYIVALAVAVAAVVIGMNSSAVDAGTERCQTKGADEICVTGKMISENTAMITTSWRYGESRPIGSVLIARIDAQGFVDCLARSAKLSSVNVFGPGGDEVSVDSETYQSLWAGSQTNLDLIPLDQIC